MNTPLQLSRAELLVLLGLLHLPLPLALGDYPADQDVAALGAALAAATAGLAARELLTIPADPTLNPTPAPAVAALLTDVALAEACLIHTYKRDGVPMVAHLTRRGATYVAHRCPQPGVHRLERLTTRAALVAQVVAALALPVGEPHEPFAPGVTLPAEVWAAALEALSAGDYADVRARLTAAGAPVAAVQALSRPTTAPTRHALVALRDLTTDAPQVDGALVLSGMAAAWLGATVAGAPAAITLTPAATATVHARVDALAAWMG